MTKNKSPEKRLNGISNVMSCSPSWIGPDLGSEVLRYQMFPLRTTPSGSERLQDFFFFFSEKRLDDSGNFTSSSGKLINSRDLASVLLSGLLNMLCDCDWSTLLRGCLGLRYIFLSLFIQLMSEHDSFTLTNQNV